MCLHITVIHVCDYSIIYWYVICQSTVKYIIFSAGTFIYFHFCTVYFKNLLFKELLNNKIFTKLMAKPKKIPGTVVKMYFTILLL